MPKIIIPPALRKFTQNQDEVTISGANVRELLDNLNSTHPGIGERIVDEQGAIRRFVNVFVGEEDIRFLENLDTPVRDADEISIVPAIAGG